MRSLFATAVGCGLILLVSLASTSAENEEYVRAEDDDRKFAFFFF